MIMTLKEAKTKICPIMSFRNYKYHSVDCYADACAIWRWDGSLTYGYCGIGRRQGAIE